MQKKEAIETHNTPQTGANTQQAAKEPAPVATDQLTKLNYEFSFWFSYFKEQRMKQTEDYESNIKKIGTFSSAEEFWGYYQHIRRPDSLPKCCEFFLFKSGVRPLWEDPSNKGGGRFVLHIKRIFANKTWEDIIIAFIISTREHDHLNGIVINVRSWEVLLSFWMKPLPTEELKEKYRNWIRNSLGMSEGISIEYKAHPNPEEVPKTRPPGEHGEGNQGTGFSSTPRGGNAHGGNGFHSKQYGRQENQNTWPTQPNHQSSSIRGGHHNQNYQQGYHQEGNSKGMGGQHHQNRNHHNQGGEFSSGNRGGHRQGNQGGNSNAQEKPQANK